MYKYKNKYKKPITYDRDIINYLKKLGFPLLFILKEQTNELCLEAIQQKYYTSNALQNIMNQSEEMCKLAVEIDGMALQFVNNQTEEICEKAIKQNGLALQFVKNKNYLICKEAIKQNPKAIKYIKEEYNELYTLIYTSLKIKLIYLDKCSICLTDDKYDWFEITNCKHCFHSNCLIEWINQNNSCPQCRINIL